MEVESSISRNRSISSIPDYLYKIQTNTVEVYKKRLGLKNDNPQESSKKHLLLNQTRIVHIFHHTLHRFKFCNVIISNIKNSQAIFLKIRSPRFFPSANFRRLMKFEQCVRLVIVAFFLFIYPPVVQVVSNIEDDLPFSKRPLNKE